MSYPPPCAQCRGASARCQEPGAHVPCGNGDLDLGSGCGCGSEPRCGWWLVREINKQVAPLVAAAASADFALATPLYPVNLRLPGGELLRLCSVVRWPDRPTGTRTSSSCLLVPVLCTNGLVHGVARSASPGLGLSSPLLLECFFSPVSCS
jgi:hypothetical protein